MTAQAIVEPEVLMAGDRDALRHRAICDQMARRGEYSAAVERAVDP